MSAPSADEAPENPDWQPAEPSPITRQRVIRLAFGGDLARFDEFLNHLRDVTPADAEVILRGSAVTGRRWSDGLPFDADGAGTSDLDVTFVGGDLVKHWDEFYLPNMHSVPLSDEHPDACPPFVALRATLSRIAARPVNLQATRSLVQQVRDLVMNQPYVVLVEQGEGRCAASEPVTELDPGATEAIDQVT